MGESARGTACGVETVLHTSVATLYSNLVTRPTGRTVRYAIERQIEEAGGTCLSILDFSHVGVLDYSCADEIIAKLLLKQRRRDRASDTFFLLQGAAEHHREPIDSVLSRQNLLLVALDGGQPELWGPAPSRVRHAWSWLDRLGSAEPADLAKAHGLELRTAGAWLNRLAHWGIAIPEQRRRYSSLTANLSLSPLYVPPVPDAEVRRAAEEIASYGGDDGSSLNAGQP